jgi:hypothetical protein
MKQQSNRKFRLPSPQAIGWFAIVAAMAVWFAFLLTHMARSPRSVQALIAIAAWTGGVLVVLAIAALFQLRRH